MSDNIFSSAKNRNKTTSFVLDDVTYKFKPPKTSKLVLSIISPDSDDPTAIARTLVGWFLAGLSDKDAETFRQRLADPKDDLDYETIIQISNHFLSEITGRPLEG